ncbi:very long chain fatty acid elongase 3 [Phascolarctos cinereus]|uniref:Elongation of very long chain fatty acids protein n=1 Tax=Phascolarctos cinereus TaxID=38626 RepID=A0A6P5IC80_PHACI|nr:elongation of very long chain fatty acids protein 3 [Phascolarctos cinereus]
MQQIENNDSLEEMLIHTYEFEKLADFRPLLCEYWTISFLLTLIYLMFIFMGQRYMKDRKGFNLRLPLAIWSFTLAIFSILGSVRTWKYLGALLMWGGLKSSLCHPGCITNSTVRFWAMLFVLSKIVEFGDTAFIILRKQQLLFLHWFHHSTVLVYTWFAYKNGGAGGFWFMTMNYGIHALMYSYYTVKALGLKPPRILPMIITTLQITQMFVGASISILSFLWEKDCGSYNFKQYFFWTFAMYITYFALFLNFFYQAYFRTVQAKAKVKAKSQ